MPRGDGTGPRGLGPGTGRRMGYCYGYPVPGFMNPGFGRGFGRGWRGGRGWGRFPVMPIEPAEPTKAEEKAMLNEDLKAIEEEKKALDQEVAEVRKRLKELK